MDNEIMFGRKKTPTRHSPLWDNIHSRMKYELHNNSDEEK